MAVQTGVKRPDEPPTASHVMLDAPIPASERERLQELRSYGILDSAPDPVFDDLSALARDIADVPIGIVSLVDENRQWFKSCLGLEAEETPRNISFCGHTILQRHPLIIENALTDGRFADNPLVVEAPHIRFYGGFPLITTNGYALGSLCVIDTVPRHLSQQQLQSLQRLARLVVQLMEKRRSEELLAESQRRALDQPCMAANPTSMFISAEQLRSMLNLMISLQERQCFALMQLQLKDLRRIAMAMGDRTANPLRRTLQSRLTEVLPADASCCELNDHEWMILLPFANLEEPVKALATTITRALEQPVKLNDQLFGSTVAIGIALFRDNYSDVSSLIADTALALRKASTQSSSAIRMIDLSTRLQAQDDLQIEVEMRHGLQTGETRNNDGALELHLQPFVAMEDGRVEGFEALARWRRPDGTVLSPDRFLPAAATAGLLADLDQQMLRMVLESSDALHHADPDGALTLSINLSDAVLSSDAAFERWLELITSHPLPAGWTLQMELLETNLQLRPDQLLQKLETLKQSGVRLAIDDFGSGYSSLDRLNRYPFDALKIDRSFIKRIDDPEHPSNRLLEVIQAMASALKLHTLAEGVETETQGHWLRRHGIRTGQGYLFGRPVPLAVAVKERAARRRQAHQSWSI
jgi:EAL domain-containing protein (putative c-di-GMP-specific phosphodiesterase class I)/GGDEF domain-containing protein